VFQVLGRRFKRYGINSSIREAVEGLGIRVKVKGHGLAFFY